VCVAPCIYDLDDDDDDDDDDDNNNNNNNNSSSSSSNRVGVVRLRAVVIVNREHYIFIHAYSRVM